MLAACHDRINHSLSYSLDCTTYCLAKGWELTRYPIRAAEIVLDGFNNNIVSPVIEGAKLTASYFKNHYDEFFTHLLAWSILFSLCGVLATRNLSGFSTITKPLLIAFGPGFVAGIIAGVVSAKMGNPSPIDLKRSSMGKNFTENIFLKAAAGATYVLAASAIPYVMGAVTGVVLGWFWVNHIVSYPAKTKSLEEKIIELSGRISMLEEAQAKADDQRDQNIRNAAQLRLAADLMSAEADRLDNVAKK